MFSQRILDESLSTGDRARLHLYRVAFFIKENLSTMMRLAKCMTNCTMQILRRCKDWHPAVFVMKTRVCRSYRMPSQQIIEQLVSSVHSPTKDTRE